MRSPLSRKRPAAPVADTPAPRRRKRTTQDMLEENRGPGLLVTGLRTLVGLAIVVAVGAVIWFGAAAIEGDEPSPLAPWNSSSAPPAPPASLADQ